MTTKVSKLYHLFLVLAILNLSTYYLFVGKSVLTIHNTNQGFWDDEIFNYYISVSFLILLTWLSYWIARKKLTSSKLIRIHLLITLVTVITVPEIVKSFSQMPRRYLDYGDGFKFSKFYGGMTFTCFIVSTILLSSELLLIKNIRRQPKKDG